MSKVPETTGQDLSQQRITAENVSNLYKNSATAFTTSTLVALLLTHLMWQTVPTVTLFGWLGVFAIVTASRALCSALYLRRRPPLEQTELWARLYFYGTLISGLVWGSAGLLFFTPGQTEYQATLFFVLGGLGAGAFASHINHLPSFYAFFLPTLLPILLRTLVEGDRIHQTMSVWGTIYIIAMLLLSRNANRTHIEAISLRFSNDALLEKVREEHRLAEQANQSKSRFLAAASHDLRQPLYALGLFTQRLFESRDTEETREVATQIERSFTSLKDLLNSLLDISKLDAGVISVHKKDISLQEILDRVNADCQPQAQSKGLTLHVHRSRACLYSDPQLLERILRNLTLNAIRYTADGTVLVGVRRRADHYELQVHDTGIGIPPQEIENIFQEFHQINNPERDREKGLGLGLSIVHRLTQLLGSEIHVQSTLGKGSCFSVSIPRGDSTMCATPQAGILPQHQGCRVLLIDDDPLVLHATSAFLEPLGYSVFKAEGGDEAIALLSEKQVEPELIISDYRLRSNHNGVDAVVAVQRYLKRNIPVIIVTGDTDPDRIREAASHEFHLLHKPISPQVLHTTIAFAMSQA